MGSRCVEILIKGIVQGVGFRPFVYRLAKELGLSGTIANNSSGVVITAKGQGAAVGLFIRRLRTEAPPLSKILSLEALPCPSEVPERGFVIAESARSGCICTQISPDTAVCQQCRREIMDRQDRRFDYAFTNCTNCGPRYTIIESLPYDRPRTSMKSFSMCQRCLAEYHDPGDRRFHAQPNCCPECGPHLFWQDKEGISRQSPLELAAQALAQGRIIALKGLGGFHIAADALSPKAVSTLRRRKKRPFKPFALMVKDFETAGKYCHVSALAKDILSSPAAPITLLPIRKNSQIAEEVAPGLDELGIMLPYTPLHHLLFARSSCPEALVMTSGNPFGEPLCTSNREALHRLRGFVDGFLLHNRKILTGVDDSVVKIMGEKARFIRRSRGFAPAPVVIKNRLHQGLAVGAELKNTFCLCRGKEVFLGQHMGNLRNLAVLEFFRKNILHLQELLEITPRFAAADLHPDYLSTRYAMETGLPLYQVQHHFAHALSVMAEHGLDRTVLALVLDGAGWGTDGTVWGGEILECRPAGFRRLGCIKPFPLPGGDMAAKEPWRMALSLLVVNECSLVQVRKRLCEQVEPDRVNTVIEMMARSINCPLTSSCGRLFDAVAALSGVCLENTCEAQAAMLLEALCQRVLNFRSVLDTSEFHSWMAVKDLWTKGRRGLFELELYPLAGAVLNSLQEGRSRGYMSLLFHCFLIAALGRLVLKLSRETGIREVVLGGGCLQNRVLLQGFNDFFQENGIKVYINERVPANDGGICLGQILAGSFMHGNQA